MIPPKYKFYVGKYLHSGSILENKSINLATGEETESVGYCASNNIYLSSQTIYIDALSAGSTSFDTYRIYVSCYDGTTYLGYLYTGGNEVIELKENTKSIRISFNIINYDVYSKMRNNTGIICEIYNANPHYKDLSKKYAKESGQEFFRVSLDGKINLLGTDYDRVNQSSLEDKLIFLIDKYSNSANKWQNYYKGEFSKTDCKLDYSKKKCELKTTAIDAYSEIMNKYENTYDLIKLAPEISKINLYKRSLIQVYVRGANIVTNFSAGTYWEDDVISVVDNNDDLKNKYHFAYIKSGNEFTIEDSSIEGINGVYAGTNGSYNNWNGYTCYLEKDPSAPPPLDAYSYFIKIRRNSDLKDIYKSEVSVTVNDDTLNAEDQDYENDKHLKYGAKLINVDNPSDSCTFHNLFTYSIYMRLLCDVDTITDSEGQKNTYDIASDDFIVDNRNYKKCIGLKKGGQIFCTSRTTTEPTRYGINDFGGYFTNNFISAIAGVGRLLPISRNSWVNASLWYAYDDNYVYYEEQLRKKYTLKDSYSVGAAIKAILKKIDPNISHEPTSEYSQFLYGDYNPLGMDRFYVYITQKTNILKGEYDQPAQKAEITLEGLMKMLRDCFRCYWYIENNKLKIEHIYFFMNGGSYSINSDYQLDFTKLTDQFNKKLSSYFQSEIEYDKSELSQRIEFAWMDDATDLFGGVTIDIKSNYVQKDKTEEINIEQFSSDIDYMLFDASNFSEDGFALLCPVKNGNELELPIVTVDNLIDENGDSYEAIIQNWYASWIYLQNFYMWDMPARNIKPNTVSELFVRGVKRCMKHSIEFSSEEDPDELELIKTFLGNGKINDMSININTRTVKANLVYSPK